MTNNYAYLGVVEKGRFRPLATEQKTAPRLRLTQASIATPESAEAEEMDLAAHEGNALLVRGFAEGEWLFSAIIVEEAGLILTAVVRAVFGADEDGPPRRLGYPLA